MKNKIFVGNVPFHCTRDEFQECFKHLEGFETADIIRRYKSKLSRGFGFVVFKDEDQANKLLDMDDIMLKDRVLRFSPYEQDDDISPKQVEEVKDVDTVQIPISKPVQSVQISKPKISYQLYISNLDESVTYDELKKCIVESGVKVSTCFVNTKNNRTTGIVSVETLEVYTKLLENPVFLNNKPLIIKPYKKNKTTANTKHANVGVAYREGFKAGHIVGFQQGYQQGFQNKDNY